MMNNEKSLTNKSKQRLFEIKDILPPFIVAGIVFLNIFIFASLGYLLLKNELSIWIGGIFGLVVSGGISNVINNRRVRQLDERESKIGFEKN